MKVQLLMLGAPLAAQGATIERRQGGIAGLLSGAASLFMKDMKPVKVVEGVTAMKRQGVKNIKVYHGPLELLPATEAAKVKGSIRSDPNSNSWFVGLQGFPQNAYILRTDSTLQYEDGTLATIANDVFNHHVQIFDIGKEVEPLFQCGKIDPSKPSWGMKMPGSYFGGSASDGAPSTFNTLDGMFNSGYYLSKQSKVIMSAELVNYSKETKKIYAVTEIDYIPGDTPGIMDTAVGIMSVNQCDLFPNPFLSGPPGVKRWDMKSKEITILQDGYMLTRRGHMHDGGTGMILKVNDKVICDSKAEYGTLGGFKGEHGEEVKALSGMHECNDPVEVKKGDKLAIEAYFDLDQHPPRKHAHGGGEAAGMALMGYVFAFKKPGTN